MKNSSNTNGSMDKMEMELRDFIDENKEEVFRRYNTILPQINAAQGKGIQGIHNSKFGSKDIRFAAAVQLLYRENLGLPIAGEEPRHLPEVEPIHSKTRDEVMLHSTATDDEENYDDSSQFIAENASPGNHRPSSHA